MSAALLRRVHRGEDGIALIVVMSMMAILGIIATGVLSSAMAGKTTSSQDRFRKQAYSAAATGFQAALYRINATTPDDSKCPPLPGQSTQLTPSVNGVCGPYDSTDVNGAQPMVNSRYQYWITPVMTTTRNPSGSTTDICTGVPPGTSTVRTNLRILERCITSVGTTLTGGNARDTSRVQGRVAAAKPFFPIPGVWGTKCVNISGGTVSTATTGCSTSAAVGTATYNGSIGSNEQIYAGMAAWGVNPNTASATDAPANLYRGYKSPTVTTPATYSVKVGDSASAVNATCPTGGAVGGGAGSPVFESTDIAPTNGCMPYANNPPIPFNQYYSLPLAAAIFASPPTRVFTTTPAPSAAACSTTTDTATCNDNAKVTTTATMTPAGCATLTGTRVLTLASGCVLRLPSGTYNFCSMVFNGASLLPQSVTATAEIRVFLDSASRSPASGCSAALVGSNLTFNGASAWMTTSTTSTSAACSATTSEVWTPLAGQLYVYGLGDPPLVPPVTGVPYRSTFAADKVNIANSAKFYGLIEAPNSTLNVNATGGCIRGGLAAEAVNIPNNASFTWDTSADLVTGQQTQTFYRRSFVICKKAIANALFPMDEC